MWTGIDWHAELYNEYFPHSGDPSARITDVLYWGDHYVATGHADGESAPDAVFFAAQDGVKWALSDREADAGPTPARLAATSDKMLAASLHGGSDAGLWSSNDGFEWESVQSPTWQSLWSDGTPRDVAGGQQGFVAVGVRQVGADSRPVLASSSDGHLWQPIDDAEVFQDAALLDVIAYFGGYAIAGIAPDATADSVDAIAVWISEDGKQWSRAEIPESDVPIPGSIQLLSGPKGMALITAEERLRQDSDRIVYAWSSPDGRTWRRDSSPEWRPFAKMFASDGTRIIILGLDDSAGGVGWVSTDGRTWARLAVPAVGDVLLDSGPPKAESMAIAPTGLVIWESWTDYQQFNGAWAVGD